MASSDDEGETVPTTVSDYEFIGDDEPISFAQLPVDWGKGDSGDGKKVQIYLKGKTDNGLRKIYVQVTAWKFHLPKVKPEISVLSVQGNWIKLLNPRKAYNDIIRTVVVTVHALHFTKWNPQRPQKALWDNLKKTLSMFERRPCVEDLADHVPLLTEAIKWDVKLEESQILSSFLAEKPWKKKTFNEDVRPPFIVDDVNEKGDPEESEKADENEDSDSEEGDRNDEYEDSDSDESDCFDSVCAICDNGGNLICCDGKCMRSFHATAEDGDDSKCESLELTAEEQEGTFICDNCKYKKHQCFACGKLGSSDESSNPEVFCCVNGACGYFYHPHCVATLSYPGDCDAIEELEKRIADGEPFVCPIHKCHICKELEVRSNPEMQFAVCRRCPKAYHRKCLPRAIAFEDGEFIQRAWEGLIPKRILIYCLTHEIHDDIQTPMRDHILFPDPRKEKKTRLELETSKNKNLSKGRGLALEDDARNRISGKQQKTDGSKGVGLSRKRLEEHPTPSSKKQKLQKLAAARASNGRFSSVPSIRREKLKQPTNDEGGVFSDDWSYSTFFGTESEQVNPQRVASGQADSEITKVKPTAMKTDNGLSLDADSRRRVLTLIKDASSSVTLEDVKKRYKPPSTHTSYSRFSTDSVTLGKVEGAIQAVHAALTKLDEGNIRDAKAVCGNDLLVQVLKWKDKLKVYLAPFLHGTRYTSFGRHFTKNDKLTEIADILHWYFQDGDMLVDFCCGSNDFSCLMKKKLDEMGKKCSFKNYDILQAKNDFNFERRDWMSVKKEELPDGSKLIMGLNPPFGLNASLANKFISKALQFKPKLLILIVPRETQRLDEKQPPYDLIWEDDQIVAGKAFYLPGSIDINDNQVEDWNNNAPLLYLWSSPSWTSKHRDIAEKHNHKSGALNSRQIDNEITSQQEGKDKETTSQQEGKDRETTSQQEGKDKETTSQQEGKDKETTSQQEGLPCGIDSTPNHESSSKSLGGQGNKKRPPSNMDKPFSKLQMSHLQSPDYLDTYPIKRGESPSQFRTERGDYRQNRELHLERDGEHRQSSLSREVSQVPFERGGYRQTSFSSHQSYSRMEHDEDGDEVSELLKKYGFGGEPEHGTSGGQAYGNHDYAQPPQHSMSSGPAYCDYTPPVATGGLMDDGYHRSPVQVNPNSWNRGAALAPNQSTGYPQQYGLSNIAPSSNYSEMSGPVSHRYAPRLHGPSFSGESHFPPQQHPNRAPLQFSNQGSLNFAQGPYHPPPHQTSSGWLHDG